jgi:hypothetical protein
MRIFLTLLLTILLFGLTLAQPVATTFQNAESQGISIPILENNYQSAAHFEPEKGVFKERQNEFLTEYQNLHIDLGKYLSEHDFEWPKTTKLFTRVYFDSSGTIDYFLINPSKANLSEKQSEKYFSLLNEFIRDYKLPISGNVRFAQCSPVKYLSKKEAN